MVFTLNMILILCISFADIPSNPCSVFVLIKSYPKRVNYHQRGTAIVLWPSLTGIDHLLVIWPPLLWIVSNVHNWSISIFTLIQLQSHLTVLNCRMKFRQFGEEIHILAKKSFYLKVMCHEAFIKKGPDMAGAWRQLKKIFNLDIKDVETV